MSSGSSTNSIADIEKLEDLLSAATAGVVDTLRRIPGDILVLGVAGKMGPTLARMLRRAADAAGGKRRIVGVSRFSSSASEQDLNRYGIETIRCDLLNCSQLDALPDAPSIFYMAGMKFGATGNESLTWAMNTHLPALVCERYSTSRIVAFSTGNIYGLSPVSRRGSVESDPPNPAGEYAMSCLGRERMFEYFSRTRSIPTVLLRLNYAVEMRYGVLLDIAQLVHAGQPIDLSMGHVNAIWQGDANAMAVQCLGIASSPPLIMNITGPKLLGVRDVAERFGQLLNREPRFSGTESPDAILSDARQSHRLFGAPTVPATQLMNWLADWLKRGLPTLNKPTHFDSRDGKY